jgi:hypothetical protein
LFCIHQYKKYCLIQRNVLNIFVRSVELYILKCGVIKGNQNKPTMEGRKTHGGTKRLTGLMHHDTLDLNNAAIS